ncbi:tripartite tricarboxylate transporter permease [Microvirga massiliensis]|uniref:tripartite tricarboxylate transporter permease n=1 Tax=Microvirga massiliensis TaxID=1033741 RepID=UPI00062BD8DF|nr:tripartite tricarboxylate transporter permease [Microvirga massiliensis]
MEFLSAWSSLLGGFERMMDPHLLLMCFIGTFAGTLVGVLPGLGPAAAVAILLPMTYGADPLSALVGMAGVYYGAMYGGTITSVLLNVPGESASVVTTFDGYPLAKQGRGGLALGLAAIGSLAAGTIGLILLTLMAVPLARAALSFGPPEYFAVMLLAFTLVSALSSESILKAGLSLFLGLLLCTVGQDVVSGTPRLTFGSMELLDGVNFLPAVVGMFGLAEVMQGVIHRSEFALAGRTKLKLKSIFPSPSDLRETYGSILRGGFLGFIFGLLPGTGATVASFMSYGVERRLSKTPEKFGHGALQGVAGPESANNSASSGEFVPLLALGIPGSATTAVLIGAFVLLGIQPGPRLFAEHPDIAWGLIASLYVGNVMLFVQNTAMIPFFVWLLMVSQRCLPVVVASLCFIGVYSINNVMSDVWMMLAFAALGYIFKICNIPPAPLIIALVLGPAAENALRQSLVISMGSPWIFFLRPISAGLLVLAAGSFFLPMLQSLLIRRVAPVEATMFTPENK